MTMIRNTKIEIQEVFNVKLNDQFKINLLFGFDFKDRIINRFQIERKKNKFQEFLKNFNNFFYIKLRVLTEKRYIIFELREKVELKEYNFRNKYFEISGIMPEIFIKHLQILAELFEWAENILEINSFDLNLKYYENDTIELKISVSKNVEKLKKILDRLFEIEKNSNKFRISKLDWCRFKELENNLLEIEFDPSNSSNLTTGLIDNIIKLINTELFSEIKVYFKSNSVWISSPDIFKYNLSIKMDELFNNIDKYIKFFSIFKYNKFIDLIINIATSNNIEKYIKDYFFVFEKFENYLDEMNSLIKLIKL